MDKARSLDQTLERFLIKIGLTNRGPAVYLGGAWHEYPDNEEEVSEDDEPDDSLDVTAESYLGPGQLPDQSPSSNQELIENEGEDEVDVQTRFITRPPESITTVLDNHHFIYAGVDPDLVDIQPRREQTARVEDVFESPPPELTGQTQWTPWINTLDDLDWEPSIPKEGLSAEVDPTLAGENDTNSSE